MIVFDEHLIHGSVGGLQRRQWRVDFVIDPHDEHEHAVAAAWYDQSIPDERHDPGYDAERYPSYGPYWQALDRGWTDHLSRTRRVPASRGRGIVSGLARRRIPLPVGALIAPTSPRRVDAVSIRVARHSAASQHCGDSLVAGVLVAGDAADPAEHLGDVDEVSAAITASMSTQSLARSNTALHTIRCSHRKDRVCVGKRHDRRLAPAASWKAS